MKVLFAKLEPLSTWEGKVAEYQILLALEDGTEYSMGSVFKTEKQYTEHSFTGMTLEEALMMYERGKTARRS